MQEDFEGVASVLLKKARDVRMVLTKIVTGKVSDPDRIRHKPPPAYIVTQADTANIGQYITEALDCASEILKEQHRELAQLRVALARAEGNLTKVRKEGEDKANRPPRAATIVSDWDCGFSYIDNPDRMDDSISCRGDNN